MPPGVGYRQNRFREAPSGGGVEGGLRDASQTKDGFNKAFVHRNLKPFKTLKPFTRTKGKGKNRKFVGLKKLGGKNTAQLENLAAKAVLKKGKVKSKKLNTTVNTSKFGRKALKKADAKLASTSKSFAPGSTAGIKNKRVRRAANHLRQIRRNQRVNKTRVGSAKAYDIFKGYRRR